MSDHAFDLDRRLDAWAGQPLLHHLSALALIMVVAVVRWHHCVLLDGPLIDEATYLAAFRAVTEGRSPFEVGSYHYTPFFAAVGGRLLGAFGELSTLALLRCASLAGLAIAVWCSSAWFAVSWTARLALSATFVALAPAAGAGLCTGNVSFAVIGVIVLALIRWPSGSRLSGAVPSGLALGATIAAKPLAPLALVALFFHRVSEAAKTGKSAKSAKSENAQSGGGRIARHHLAGLLGGVTAAALILPMLSRLGEMTAQPIHRLSYARSFSLQRLLALAGIEVSSVAIVLAGAVVLIAFLRCVRLDRSQLLAVAVTASVLVTPIVWNHTLVLTLPVQVMALAIAIDRWRTASGNRSRKRSYELVLVTLGALAIQLSEGIGAVDELSRAAQLAFISLPCFAPVLLTAYVLVSTGLSGAGSGRRKR